MTREEAIRIIETVFQDEYVYKYYDSITHQALNMAIEALQADMGSVVRCKDCKYLNRKEAFGDEWKECTHYPQHHIRLNDFCSYGERKEDADLGYGENWKEFKSKACEEAIKALKDGR